MGITRPERRERRRERRAAPAPSWRAEQVLARNRRATSSRSPSRSRRGRCPRNGKSTYPRCVRAARTRRSRLCLARHACSPRRWRHACSGACARTVRVLCATTFIRLHYSYMISQHSNTPGEGAHSRTQKAHNGSSAGAYKQRWGTHGARAGRSHARGARAPSHRHQRFGWPSRLGESATAAPPNANRGRTAG